MAFNRLTQTLAGSAARTVSGSAAALEKLGNWERATFVLECTSTAMSYGDTLNVYVQASFDGSMWYDVAAFEQIHGNEGSQAFWKRTAAVGGLAVPDHTPMLDGGMLAGTIFPCFSPGRLRAKWRIVNASGAAGFTFSVRAELEYP